MDVYNNSLSPLSIDVIHGNDVRYVEHGCLSVYFSCSPTSIDYDGTSKLVLHLQIYDEAYLAKIRPTLINYGDKKCTLVDSFVEYTCLPNCVHY